MFGARLEINAIVASLQEFKIFTEKVTQHFKTEFSDEELMHQLMYLTVFR